MTRLMGILTGSAIAVALLIVMLGMPEFAAEHSAPQRPVETVAEMPRLPPPDVPDAPQTEPIMQTPEQVVETISSDLFEAEKEALPAPPAEPVIPDEELAPAGETRWFAFWSPFRSEIAAAGFVSELQRTTVLDYRVDKLKTGVYEVGFAYSDESDIEDKLASISTATGLEFGGG